MILRYQQFAKRLNHIRKVCSMHNMTIASLDPARGHAAALTWWRDVVQAFHRSMPRSFGPAGLPR
jgi:hypothetical protein